PYIVSYILHDNFCTFDLFFFFFSSRRRHTRSKRDWSSDVCSSDLLLLSNKGRVFSIDEIYEKVWNEESFNVENTVAVHIRRIREKIEINPKEPRYLKVVWGIGYKIEKL